MRRVQQLFWYSCSGRLKLFIYSWKRNVFLLAETLLNVPPCRPRQCPPIACRFSTLFGPHQNQVVLAVSPFLSWHDLVVEQSTAPAENSASIKQRLRRQLKKHMPNVSMTKHMTLRNQQRTKLRHGSNFGKLASKESTIGKVLSLHSGIQPL